MDINIWYKNVIGYICFKINENHIYLAEMEIAMQYQQDKESFPLRLKSFLFNELVVNKDIIYYANTKNIKAINFYKYIGFKSENISSNKIKFFIDYYTIKSWFLKKYSEISCF